MASGSHIEPLLNRLRANYGRETNFGRSKRLFQFGSRFTCSINYSKELRGTKFFYGLSLEVLDQKFGLPATNHGHFVLLICGRDDLVLWLPRKLVLNAMYEVPTRKLDVFLEEGRYILQTTRHPKMDVTEYLNASPPIDAVTGGSDSTQPETGRSHSEVQLGLAKLGNAEGCHVWVPTSDRNLRWKNDSLRDFTCDKLPSFGFDENTRRVISNIDVLWLEGNVIRRAFEIEATTSIYSGLLRLNDLILAQPNNRIDLSIVADASRKQRVIGQIMRPTFRALADICSFVPFNQIRNSVEEVDELKKRGVTRIQGLLKTERFSLPKHFVFDPIDL